MPTSRRKLLLLSGLSAALTAGALGALRKYRGNPEDPVVAILKRRLAHLDIRGQDLRTFATAYVQHHEEFRRELGLMSVLSGPLGHTSPYALLSLGHYFRRLEDSVVSLFLLSTDFFQNDAAEDRRITYVGFYDPFETICRNPLMRHV